MAQRLCNAVVCAFGQSPARLSHRSGSPISALCSSIRRARLTRPRRSQRWQATSSIVSLPCSSPRVIDPRLLIAAAPIALTAPRYHSGLLPNALPWGMLDSAYQAIFLTLVIALAIAVGDGKGTATVGYNVQIAVDAEHHLIVA